MDVDKEAEAAFVCIYLGYLGIENATPSDSLSNDLGLDSLDAFEFGMGLEEEYDIHIPDTDMNKWRTVQDVVNSVIKLLEEV